MSNITLKLSVDVSRAPTNSESLNNNGDIEPSGMPEESSTDTTAYSPIIDTFMISFIKVFPLFNMSLIFVTSPVSVLISAKAG